MMSTNSVNSLKGAFHRLGLGIAALLIPGLASAEYALTFQKPVTPTAHELLGLHNMILIIITVIFIVVAGAMFYSLFAHRKSKGYKAATFHESTTVEVIWTTIPFLILIAMAIPSTAALLKMEDTSNSDMTLKITGYQWKWHYEYLDEDIKFFSSLSTPRDQIENKAEKGENYLLEVDNPVVLPIGKKIRMVITANDVLHAWWVPALAVKKDAIPGYINEMWAYIEEPGIYRGQCAELCGKDHGFMPIVVNAVSEEDYKKWVSGQKTRMAAAEASAGKAWSKADLIKKGEKVYQTSCAACHGATGAGIANIFPAITGSKIATGDIKGHMSITMNGKPGTAMQAFKGQLNDVDLAAVITYERNALGNSTGDMVQPAQIKAAR